MVMLDHNGHMVETAANMSGEQREIERSRMLLRIWFVVSLAAMIALSAGIIALA